MMIRCSTCGGDISVIDESKSLYCCDYCHNMITIPKKRDEDSQNLFNRATGMRQNKRFDDAIKIYNKILDEDDDIAEAHFGIALCRYGIEYVKDVSGEYVPTCGRFRPEPILADMDYRRAVELADEDTATEYEFKAKQINKILQRINEVVSREEPYDIFICYKESGNNGERTEDSVQARKIYDELTDKGYRVFFARKTLESKVGEEYEPYIYAALHSAKVMLLVTSSTDHANAVWVKNEWSRFLDIMKEKKDRRLYPLIFKMQPEDLPVELSVLQAQNIMKMGFLEELCDGLDRIFHKTRTVSVQPVYKPPVSSGTVSQPVSYQSSNRQDSLTANARFAEKMTKRGYMSLEDGDWDNAARQFKSALDKDSRYAQAYIGRLMAQNRLKKESELANLAAPLMNQHDFQQACRYATPEYQKVLDEYVRKNKGNERAFANRIFEYLARGQWDMASKTCEQVMEYSLDNPKVYIGKLMAQEHLCREEDMVHLKSILEENNNFKRAYKCADKIYRQVLEEYAVKNRAYVAGLEGMLEQALREQKWDYVRSECQAILRNSPNNASILLIDYMAQCKASERSQLAWLNAPLEKQPAYINIVKNATGSLRDELLRYQEENRQMESVMVQNATNAWNEDKWDDAVMYSDRAFQFNQNNAQANFIRLMAGRKINRKNLSTGQKGIENEPLYQKAYQYADEAFRKTMQEYAEKLRINELKNNNKVKNKENLVTAAVLAGVLGVLYLTTKIPLLGFFGKCFYGMLGGAVLGMCRNKDDGLMGFGPETILLLIIGTLIPFMAGDAAMYILNPVAVLAILHAFNAAMDYPKWMDLLAILGIALFGILGSLLGDVKLARELGRQYDYYTQIWAFTMMVGAYASGGAYYRIFRKKHDTGLRIIWSVLCLAAMTGVIFVFGGVLKMDFDESVAGMVTAVMTLGILPHIILLIKRRKV